jgi:hypothetical protein
MKGFSRNSQQGSEKQKALAGEIAARVNLCATVPPLALFYVVASSLDPKILNHSTF